MHVLPFVLVLLSLITVAADKEIEPSRSHSNIHHNDHNLVRVKRGERELSRFKRVKRDFPEFEAELIRSKRTKRHAAQLLEDALSEPELKREKRMRRDTEMNEPHLVREKRFKRDIESAFDNHAGLTQMKRDADTKKLLEKHLTNLDISRNTPRSKRANTKNKLGEELVSSSKRKHSHSNYKRLVREAKQLQEATHDILKKIEKRSVTLAKRNTHTKFGKTVDKKNASHKRSSKSLLPKMSMHKKHADKLKELERKLNINFEHGIDTLGHINKKFVKPHAQAKHKSHSTKKALGAKAHKN